MSSMCVGEHDSRKTISLSWFLMLLYIIGKTQHESLKYFQWEKEDYREPIRFASKPKMLVTGISEGQKW